MKKKMAFMLAVVLVASMLTSAAFALPSGSTAHWGGSTVTLPASEITDGKALDFTATLNIDPELYDYFDSCNLSLEYDKELIDLYGSVGSSILVEDTGYMLSPMEIPGVGYNVIVSNLPMSAPSADGYSCTVTVRMKVVDAAKVKAAGGATVTVGCFDNDFNVSKNGQMYFYQHNVAGNGQIVMNVTYSPLKLIVNNGGTVNDTWGIIYNTNGGNPLSTSNVIKGESINLPTPTKSGNTFDGWYTDSALTNKVTATSYTPTSDITLYAKWKTTPAETWKVTYNTNGGSAIADASVTKGESINLPTPTKSGNTFDGWYTDSALTNKITTTNYTPTSDITLYAKWTVTSPGVETWKITFDTNGGNTISAIDVEKGKNVTLPTPTRSGYTFEGWYSDSALTSKVTSPYTPTKSITLYAKWTENAADTYTITYNTNGGNSLANSSVKAGSSVTLPTPTRSGYNFAGWYTDSGLKDKVASPYTPTADVTLYAKWTAASSSSNVPKTGIESSVPALGGTLGGLVLCAGAVMFSQRRKKDED